MMFLKLYFLLYHKINLIEKYVFKIIINKNQHKFLFLWIFKSLEVRVLYYVNECDKNRF